MHGLGNDFILIDGRETKLDDFDLKKLAIDMCDRHYGIGADGLLIAWPSTVAEVRMQIFNPDGSEAEMCGNGIRCFARYIYETAKQKKDVISIETKAGIRVPAIMKENDQISGVEVDMGEPRLKRSEIPMLGEEQEHVINEEIMLSHKACRATCVSMGNPHCVIFVKSFKDIDFLRDGPAIETAEKFPEGTNVEFARIQSQNEVEVKVWERGAGETLACGTGACAVVVAGVLNGLLNRKTTVNLPGGPLEIEWEEDNHVCMRGPAETIFKGEYIV
jgi:diaminopimelate epimerase